MKDILHVLKRKYNNSLSDSSLSNDVKQRDAFNYFSALILQRGSFSLPIVEEQISKASDSSKESLKSFYNKIEDTVKLLEKQGYMEYDPSSKNYLFSSELWRDKLEKRLKLSMVSKEDIIINFKNDKVKLVLSDNLKKLSLLLNQDEDEVMKFLYTSSKMLPFSFNNKVMAHIQSMENSLVIDSLQSIDFWNQKKVYIKKGEKGIDLIVPSHFPLFEYENGQPKLNENGEKIPQLGEEGHFKFGLRFVLKKSFDKSQVNLNQYQHAEYHIRNDYKQIVSELKYAISKSPLLKHISFYSFESKEDELVDLFTQISNNFSGTEEQKNALKYLFSAYSDLYIPHQHNYPMLNNEELSELKEAIEYSKTVARVLNIENIFFHKEKNIYQLKGKEDALSKGSKHVTLDEARENAKEIDRIEYQIAYLNEFKNEYKRGYTNETKRTRNIYNHNDRERSERTRNQVSEISSQRANQREEIRRVQGQQSQGDTPLNDDINERRGLQRERGLGDSSREILSSERKGVESTLVKLHDHLAEQTYNAVVFEENYPFVEALNRFGKEAIEDFPNLKNKQYLKKALKNPNQYNILEVENYHGSIAHYLLIKNEYSYLYESEKGSAYIEIDKPMTSSTAWSVKEKNPKLMQSKLGEYHVYNRQLAQYLNYPLLQNNNTKLTQAINENSTQEIRAENIHKVYPTMSEEEKEAWQDTLDSLFQSRVTELRNEIVAPLLDFKNREDTRSNRTSLFFQYGELEHKGAGRNVVGMKFFEIEDRLQPIEEYIQILKESETFKSLENSENSLQRTLIKNADFIQKRVGISYEIREDNRAEFIVDGQHFLIDEKGHLVEYHQGKEQRSEALKDKITTRKETISFIEKHLIEELEVETIKEESPIRRIKPKQRNKGINLFDLAENQTAQAKSQSKESPFKNFDFSIPKEEKEAFFRTLKGKEVTQFLFDESLYLGKRNKVKEELFEAMLRDNLTLYADYEKTIEERLKETPHYIEYFHSEDGIIEMEKLFVDKFKEDVLINGKSGMEGFVASELSNISYTALVDNGGDKYEEIDESKLTQEDYINSVAYIKITDKASEFFPLRVPAHVDMERYDNYVKSLPLGNYTEDDFFTDEEKATFEKVDKRIETEQELKSEIIESLDGLLKDKISKNSLYMQYGIRHENNLIFVKNNLTKEEIELDIKPYSNEELSLKVDELLQIGNYLHLNEKGQFDYQYDAPKHEIKVLNLKEHYNSDEIEAIFIHRGVIWEIFSDNYIFDLSDKGHRDLLKNKLEIIVDLNKEREVNLPTSEKEMIALHKVESVKEIREEESIDEHKATTKEVLDKGKADFVITKEEKVGAKTKFRNNVNALDVIAKLEKGHNLTLEERVILSKYTGWGGIPQAFYKADMSVSKGWESEAEELKSLMSKEQYAEARRSTLDSFYTPVEVTKEMWRAIENMGFKGGNILEPSIGIGGFIGTMPIKFKSNTKIYGVELNQVTAKIATELYPSVKMYNVGFQDFSMEHVPVTLVIGNPPFGDIKYEHHDKEENAFRKLTIHNYFMAKAIDSLEEGGVMAMVVSNAFLDAQDDTTRQYIHKSSDLLDAIRLPNTAFKDSAHTEVTTDILFFRKRLRGERADYDGWVHLDTINETPINKYFTYREKNLLGEWGKFGTMYGGGLPALVEREGQNTQELLRDAIDRLPKKIEIIYQNGGGNNQKEDIFFYAKGNVTKEEKRLNIGDNKIKVGSLFVQESKDLDNLLQKEINLRLPDVNGEVRFKKIDYLLKRTNKETGEVEVTVNQKQIARVEGMIGIVQVANDLRKAQIDKDYSNEDIEEIRGSLNGLYDTFIKKYGHLNSATNKRLFSYDIDAPFLLSLELEYEKGVSQILAKKTGEGARKPFAIKSEIFSKRTQYPYSRPERAETEEEALYIALGETGFVDVEYISTLLNKSESEIERSLEHKGFIFNDPVEGWVSREEYLSGDVKRKYQQTTNPNYLRELKEVIPKDIEPHDISVQLGAGWIPESDLNEFLKVVTQNDAQSTYVPFSADWTIKISPTDSSRREWETNRADLKKIILSALNNKQIIIHDTFLDPNGNEAKRVNEDATIAANDKMEALKEKFDKWIWSSEERRERLGKIYNDKFNRHAPREYDGSHLKFVGKVDDSVFELRPHQRDAVYRGIVEGKMLLDHTVGTGKTATLICTIMEMKRMNKVNKQLLAVPNHLVGQWAKEWLELYPNANILASDKKDFEKANRQQLFSKMTTGNYDVIIIAHSQLSKIQNDPSFTKRFLDEQIETINNAIDQVRAIEGKDTRTVKQYEKNRVKLEEQVASLLRLDRDNLITFKELGVDALAIDEAHEFKNLQYTTSLQRVGGLGNPEGSKKAFDLFIKARMLGEETGEKNLFFLTGTPISNTIAEMYTMQKYMDYQQLKENDILHFDAWVKQYAEVVSDWELSPSGKYQMRSRLSKFKNMPELMQSYRSFADVVTREQIQTHLAKLGKRLAVPDMIGGKPNNIINERSEQQAMFIGVPDKDGRYPKTSLVYRSENIPKKPKKGDDNMLVIMSEARKCALDMRLINPNAHDDKNSKVNIMLKHLLSQYKVWDDFKGVQLIFCDLSTPKNSSNREKERIENLVILAENGTDDEKRLANRELSKLSEDDLMALKSSFDVYNDIKSKLIKEGISEKEIAFIHDANTDKKKAELFNLVNGGKVRFLLGSTSKMGAGMNAQQKLVGLHHLDAPWRPSDLEQREGRIIRQGNFIYNLFDIAKKYSEDTSMENFKEFAKALKLMGMKEEEFREALERLPSKKFEVMVNRYATKATLDSRMWQTLETKAKFIEQIKLAGFDEREVEDISLESSNSAEMKAISSGNPLILEEMTLKKDIKKLEALAKNHMFTQFNIEKDIERLSKVIEKFPKKIKEYEEDVANSNALKSKIEEDGFFMVINNKTFDNREKAGEEILSIFSAIETSSDNIYKNTESINLGKFGSFDLFIERESSLNGGNGIITLKENDLYEFEIDLNSSPIGISTKIVNLLNKPTERYEKLLSEFENAKTELPKIKNQVEDFRREDELLLLKNRYKQVIVELRPKEEERSEEHSKDKVISKNSSEEEEYGYRQR